MTSKILLSLCCSLMIAMPCSAAAADLSTPLIRQQASPDLQQRLEQRIKQLHLSKATRQKRLSVTLVDVTDPSAPVMAQINGDEMMYAASLPKIAILLAAFERIAEGKMALNDDTRQTMTNMIRHSSNAAATTMIRAVGKDYINQVLSSPKYRLYDKQHNGGLWVGKEYAGSKAFHRDPLHNLSHGATALQVARFYYMLETGRLVSPDSSQEMKTIMSKPGINHKFVKGLMTDYPEVEMYRKSGSWRNYHADSALIEHNGRRYIAVALANDPKGGEWMARLIHEMDDIIFKHAGFASADAAAPQIAAADTHKRLM
ncbi:beta-lactamase class A [Mariprofundus aestuarium]|uniref:beta-lactamase n=1 Tax=Mariprofundus aestuarium TaxID=1921086 RepID=A0A2K8KZ63_MARES|nr:serine hydrolase [Mariprofundus aestuarium]ATX79199.1 beta-lactamase class A [Mariprofundus aestuarium]